MKKILLLPALLIAIVMGLFVRERIVLSALERDVREKTAALHASYAETALTHLPAFHELGTGDMAIVEAADRIQALAAPLPENGGIAENVATLNDLQLAIRELVRAGSGNEELAAHPSYGALQTEIGERSGLRPMINDFNGAARAWNERRASRLGAVMVNVMDEESDQLHYLRFDGETETETTISL